MISRNYNYLDSSILDTPSSLLECPSPKMYTNSTEYTPVEYVSPEPLKTPETNDEVVTNIIFDIKNKLQQFEESRHSKEEEKQARMSHEELSDLVETIVNREYIDMERRIRTTVEQDRRLSAIERNIENIKISFDSFTDK